MEINSMIEIKKEYTKICIDLISIPFYQGIQHLYDSAVQYSKSSLTGNSIEMKIFQDFLKSIVPNWNNETLEKETFRIKVVSKAGENLDSLINTIIKTNILILSHNTKFLSKNIDMKNFHIPLHLFIHKCYIQIARMVFNNPFLFYHKLPPIEIKRNQRDAMILIKEAIITTLRQFTPLHFVLNEYEKKLNNHIQSIEDNKLQKNRNNKQLSSLQEEILKSIVESDTFNKQNTNLLDFKSNDFKSNDINLGLDKTFDRESIKMSDKLTRTHSIKNTNQQTIDTTLLIKQCENPLPIELLKKEEITSILHNNNESEIIDFFDNYSEKK